MGKPPIARKPWWSLRPTFSKGLALVALVVGYNALLQLGMAANPAVAAFAALFLPCIVLAAALLDLFCPGRCPGCGSWSLRRLARSPTHYRCVRCGARQKRSAFGAWRDASGPEDDAIYRGKARTHRWLGFTIPQIDDSTTLGRLVGALRRKRTRRAESGVVKAPLIGSRFGAGSGEPVTTTRRPDLTLGVLVRHQRERRERRGQPSRGQP
jgi:hypothetical protein